MRYKKAIEELENHIQNISVRDGELLDAIDFAIGIMMEVDNAEKVMPANIYSDIASQKVWEQCTLTHAKVVSELKEEIAHWKNSYDHMQASFDAAYTDMVSSKIVVAVMRNEIDELKEKLKKYEGDTAIVGGKEVPIRY